MLHSMNESVCDPACEKLTAVFHLFRPFLESRSSDGRVERAAHHTAAQFGPERTVP